MSFPVLDVQTAPAESRDTLLGAERAFGFVPNMLGVMAHAPALLKGYLALSRLFDESSLTVTERQLVLLAVSHENACGYCLAAHTAIAGMQGVPIEVVHAAREGRLPADPRLAALWTFTRAVVARRGYPTSADRDAFLAAGYAPHQILEVVLGVGVKTLSNYTNHLADTPIDAAFAGLNVETRA